MSSIEDDIRSGFLGAGVPTELVDELFRAFAEAKKRYYVGDLRPTGLEGGRFSEAAFRILQWATQQAVTPLGKTMPKVDTLLSDLLKVSTSYGDSLRLHIPRTLRLIYDIRNKRDISHLGDGIDPNQQDSSIVIAGISWVMAELVRHFHQITPDAAQRIIDSLVRKEVPAIQLFDGQPRLLKKVTASEHVLSLLYWCSPEVTDLATLRESLIIAG